MAKDYKHLTFNDRLQIEVLLKAKHKPGVVRQIGGTCSMQFILSEIGCLIVLPLTLAAPIFANYSLQLKMMHIRGTAEKAGYPAFSMTAIYSLSVASA